MWFPIFVDFKQFLLLYEYYNAIFEIIGRKNILYKLKKCWQYKKVRIMMMTNKYVNSYNNYRHYFGSPVERSGNIWCGTHRK